MTARALILLTALLLLAADLAPAQSPPTGRLAAPQAAPSDPDLVAFVRLEDDGQSLHLYDHGTGVSTPVAVRPAQVAGASRQDPLASLFDTAPAAPSSRYTGDLAWRPVLDARGRQWFAFVSSEGADGYDLYLSYVRPDGTLAPEPPLHLAQRGLARSPAWSPDGRHLAYVHGDDRGSDLHVLQRIDRALRSLDAEDLVPTAVATPYTNEFFPAWSPTGDYIALQQQAPTARGMRSGLAVLPVADLMVGTAALAPLDAGLDGHDLLRPTFSPDGTLLAFYMTQSRVGERGDERQDLGLVRLNAPSATGRFPTVRLLRGVTPRIAADVLPHDDRGPTWTGERLLVVLRDAADDNPIAIADVARWRDGRPGHLQTLPQLGTLLHRDPAVHPSGRLVYVSHHEGALRLHMRDLPVLQQRIAAVPITLRRRTAVARSLLLPGLGQRYKGQRGKAGLALVMTGVTAASTAGVLAATLAEEKRLRDIQTSRAAHATQAGAVPGTPEWWRLRNRYRFDEKRASKDRADGLRTVLIGHLGLLAGLWTVSAIDAALGVPRVRLHSSASSTFAIRPSVRLDTDMQPHAALNLSLRW